MRQLPLLLAVTACTPNDSPFDAATTETRLLVAYEDGAEPYTGSVGPTFGDAWDLYANNLGALFEGTEVAVTHPRTLGEMTTLGSLTETAFSTSRILALADDQLPDPGETGVVAYRALWLDGYFERDGEADPGVLGVSLGDTRVIAMFKPVIESAALLGPVRTFTEQSTVVHEVGHALGLVNNGLPMVNDHHDADNGAHCTNDRCIMYWANEGVGDLVEFVEQVVTTGDEVLFDADCQEDVQAARDG